MSKQMVEEAQKHVAAGGERLAYFAGWEAAAKGKEMRRAKKPYSGEAEHSFIAGFIGFLSQMELASVSGSS